MKENKNATSCFDWLQLIIYICIPVAIAVYTVLENNRESAIAMANRAHDLHIADDEQKDLILNECQKVLSKLIEKHGTEFDPGSSTSLVVRFAVLSALNRLDLTRRNFLIRLLYEAKLITCQTPNCRPSIDLQSANLMDLSFDCEYQRKELYYLSLENTVMSRADFFDMNIHGGNFKRAKLDQANFAWTRNDYTFENCANSYCMENVSTPLSFEKANLTMASFHTATYGTANFIDAIMTNVNLDNFFCGNCIFQATDLSGVNFRDAGIHDSSMLFIILDNADLQRSVFGPNVEFSSSSMKNTNAGYTHFMECQFSDFDFQNTLFDHVSFTEVTFAKSNMIKVSMEYSRIINTTFTSINLSDSNWRYVHCQNCIFDRVNFMNADFSYATFIESDFTNAIITEGQLKQMKSLEHSLLPRKMVLN
ncbi:hypothetical protein I4U23_023634 [Adineta vaga]|nr:hypothetical protein I4U23_023634 [Adineta vaga]